MPEDTEAALAWQTWQATICGGCGHSWLDTVAEMGDGDQPDYSGYDFRCRACEAKDALREQWSAEQTGRHGIHVVARESRGE